jgi:endonuclease/exonuclease/phosphatase family metal-dependent hydrolase
MEFYICIKEFQLKIATLNIDWFKKSKALKRIIQEEINKQDLDFLIVNENIESFSFDATYLEYHSKSIPTNGLFQHLDYGIYLNGETPVRTSIYSKHQSIQEIKTIDNYTSIGHKFTIDGKEIVIYGTIIGTWGIKHQDEIAKIELENFKNDIKNILIENENVLIIGDFNTSFFDIEKRQLPTIKSRTELINFTDNFDIYRATEQIKNCIDHIFISDNLNKISKIKTSTFLENNILKDDPHKGIILELFF